MRSDPERQVSARRRLNVCAGVGVVVGGLSALWAPWQLAVLLGWDVAASVLITWVVAEIVPSDSARTARWSAPEDNSHRGAVVIITAAAVMSLAGMAFGMAEARRVDGAMTVALTIASVASVVLSWAVVHLGYMLRYAHLYYRDHPGGIDFHSDDAPDYRDFAYLAFTVGMSFAVSDTDVSDRDIRRTCLQHALVSYLFGAVIVGLTINVMAGFVR